MKKGDKWYQFSFTININYYDNEIYGNLFAQNDEEALNKLPNKIQERIGYITTNIKDINLERKHEIIRHFTNFEDMLQELTKA